MPAPNDPPPSAGIKALDPETGKTMWDFKLFQGSLQNGVMATAGGVQFAALREGNLIALDGITGKFLWRYQTGGNMSASPMSFAVDGRQYIAVVAGYGRNSLAPEIDSVAGQNMIYVFALPKSGPGR